MDLKKLQPPLERQLALLGFELVHLEAAREGRDEVLRLYIDHLEQARGGITLDDCVAANDGLVAWMDVEFPSLREDVGLEISSPGLERPLTRPAHYQRFAGRLCRIQVGVPLNGQKRFKGWIHASDEGAVTLEEDGQLKRIPYDAIQKARLAPFDEDGAPPPKLTPRAADPASTQGGGKGRPSRPGKAPQASKPKHAAPAADEQAGAETSTGREA